MYGESSGVPQEVIDVSLADRAEKLFRQVSAQYPGLEVAQGVALALLCQTSHLDPYQLGKTLCNDTHKIENLTRQANSAHRNLELNRVTPEQTKGIVITDFHLAGTMLSFPPTELQQLLNEFATARKSVKSKRRYRIKVLDIIKRKSPDQNAPRIVNVIRRKMGMSPAGFWARSLIARLTPPARPLPRK